MSARMAKPEILTWMKGGVALAAHGLTRWIVAVSAVLCFLSNTACNKEATGVLGSVERERVLSDSGSLEWKINSLSVSLDDGRTVTLKGENAKSAFDLVSGRANAPSHVANEKYRLKLHRSWPGGWRVVEI